MKRTYYVNSKYWNETVYWSAAEVLDYAKSLQRALKKRQPINIDEAIDLLRSRGYTVTWKESKHTVAYDKVAYDYKAAAAALERQRVDAVEKKQIMKTQVQLADPNIAVYLHGIEIARMSAADVIGAANFNIRHRINTGAQRPVTSLHDAVLVLSRGLGWSFQQIFPTLATPVPKTDREIVDELARKAVKLQRPNSIGLSAFVSRHKKITGGYSEYGGIVVVFDAAETDSTMRIATAVCSPYDKFDHVKGVRLALERFIEGKTSIVPIYYITSEKTQRQSIDETLTHMFSVANVSETD